MSLVWRNIIGRAIDAPAQWLSPCVRLSLQPARWLATASERMQRIREADPKEDINRFLRASPRPDSFPFNVEEILQLPQSRIQSLLQHNAPLIDTFGRSHTYLRISLTERCNLRCLYCMPEEGVELQPKDALLKDEEVISLVRLFARLGVNKVRLTGGEPLIRSGVEKLIQEISNVPGIQEIGITTNGLVLARKAEALRAAGVTAVNISLDTLSPVQFEEMTRRKGFHNVLKAIDACIHHNFPTIKLNCVIMRGHNLAQLNEFVAFTKNCSVDVRFIEFMPFGDNKWDDSEFVSYKEMLELIEGEFGEVERLHNSVHDTAKSYRLPDASGQFGFITSMSQHFCGGCNRLRITADGNLKVCLFDNREVSLRDMIRRGVHEDTLAFIISAAVRNKHFSLGGRKHMHDLAASENRPMILIGG